MYTVHNLHFTIYTLVQKIIKRSEAKKQSCRRVCVGGNEQKAMYWVWSVDSEDKLWKLGFCSIGTIFSSTFKRNLSVPIDISFVEELLDNLTWKGGLERQLAHNWNHFHFLNEPVLVLKNNQGCLSKSVCLPIPSNSTSFSVPAFSESVSFAHVNPYLVEHVKLLAELVVGVIAHGRCSVHQMGELVKCDDSVFWNEEGNSGNRNENWLLL